ncbi:hypothetical protein U1Q18_009857 [Sarracenia purpurea var. burkii]
MQGQRGHEEQTIQMKSDTGSSDSKEWIKVSKNRNKKGKRSTKQGKIQGDGGKKVDSPPLPTRESIDMRMGSGERRKRQAKSRGESHPVAQHRGPSARSANQSVVQLGYSASALCLGVQAGSIAAGLLAGLGVYCCWSVDLVASRPLMAPCAVAAACLRGVLFQVGCCCCAFAEFSGHFSGGVWAAAAAPSLGPAGLLVPLILIRCFLEELLVRNCCF